MTGEGLQILTYTLHSWTLSSECSLARHTYCDTGHLRVHVRLAPAAERLAVELSGFRTPNLSWKH